MSYPLKDHCPCCRSALQAEVTVRCEGHGEHEVSLELAPDDTTPMCEYGGCKARAEYVGEYRAPGGAGAVYACSQHRDAWGQDRTWRLLAPDETERQSQWPMGQIGLLALGAESCALCESPWCDAAERQACAERRAQERLAAERGYA